MDRDGLGGDASRVRIRASSVAGIGAFWGLGCYGVLWEGVPVVVGRPFVESIVGTLVLLPARALLAAIHLGESLSGRTLLLGDDHAWLAPPVALIGAAIALCVLGCVRLISARR